MWYDFCWIEPPPKLLLYFQSISVPREDWYWPTPEAAEEAEDEAKQEEEQEDEEEDETVELMVFEGFE